MAEGKVLPPLILELRAKAGEALAQLREVGEEAKKVGEESETGSSKSSRAFSSLAGVGKAVTFGLVGMTTAVGAFGIEAARSGEVADAKLDTAIRNVGGDVEKLEPQIDSADSKMRNFGYTNVDTNTALAGLTTALGSPVKALEDLQVAADLARAKNIPLAQSAIMVAKAAEGQTRPLKALGIDLPVLAGGAEAVKQAQLNVSTATTAATTFLQGHNDAINTSSKYHLTYEQMLDKVQAAQQRLALVQHSGATIMATLEQRVKGSAAAFGGTLQGKIESAHAQLDNLGEKVGDFLIPKLNSLLGTIESLVGWFEHHTTTAKILAGVIGGVLAISVAAYVAQLVKAKVQSTIAFAKMVGGWLGIGPAAKTAATAATEASTEIAASADEAAAGVDAAAADIEATEEGLAVASDEAGAAIDVGLGPIGLAIGAIGLAITLLSGHWKQIWGGIESVAKDVWNDGLKPVFTGFMDVVDAVWDDVIHPVFDFIGDHWKLLLAIIAPGLVFLITHWRDVWNGIKDVWSDVIKPVFDAIKSAAEFMLHGIESDAKFLAAAWKIVWGDIKTAVSDVWNDVLKPIFGFIKSVAIDPITDAINDFGKVWHDVWGAIKSVVSDVWNFIKGIFDKISSGVSSIVGDVKSVGNGISSVVHAGGDFNPLNWDDGGPVPGPVGAPVAGVVHGGEYVLSHGMLTGSQPIDAGVVGAVLATAGKTGALSGMTGASNPPAALSLATMGGGVGGGSLASGHHGGSETVTIENVIMLDGREIARSTERHQLKTGQRRGVTYQAYVR